MNFRKLKADEIDCRVSTVSEKGLSLLLYKDARVDMRILDETVGAENWQRRHTLINGNLFCEVGIYIGDRNEWVWKQDVGTESNTEKEKGQASDSFKRACFNWGIGRELYSAPFIWIPANQCNITNGRNGKLTCNDRFDVTGIGYDEDGNINALTIKNTKTWQLVYVMGWGETPKPKQQKPAEAMPGYPPESEMRKDCENYYKGGNLKNMLDYFGVSAIKDLNGGQLAVAWSMTQKGKK